MNDDDAVVCFMFYNVACRMDPKSENPKILNYFSPSGVPRIHPSPRPARWSEISYAFKPSQQKHTNK